MEISDFLLTKTIDYVILKMTGGIYMSVQYVGMTQSNSTIWPEHSHNIWEIILNLSGSGIMSVDGEEYEYGSGTVLICPPGTNHTKRSKSGFSDIFLHFDSPPPNMKNSVLVFNDNPENTIRILMYKALNYYNRKSQGYKEILNAILPLILTIISCDITDKRSDIVRQVEDELIKHYIDPHFTLKKLYDSIPLDEDHVRRCFKKETGITPNTYLTNLRIDNAKRILKKLNPEHEKINISDLSFRCGYNDALYFSKVFKKITGFSPREYLKQKKKQAEFEMSPKN